jgi:hypothetical protein
VGKDNTPIILPLLFPFVLVRAIRARSSDKQKKKMKHLQLLWLLVVCATAIAIPSKDVSSFQRIGERQFKKEFEVQGESGEFVGLTYEATLTKEPIFFLDNNKSGITSVQCSEKFLVFSFNETSIIDSIKQSTFIVGQSSWCNSIESIMRRVVNLVELDHSKLTVETSSAELIEMFEHLDFKYRGNRFHKRSIQLPNTRLKSSHPIQDWEGSVWDWVSSNTKKVADDIASTANDIYQVGNAAFTGDINESHDIPVEKVLWNFDATTGQLINQNVIIDADVSCNGCYVHADLDFVLNLNIASYKLTQLELYMEGQFNAGFGGTWSVTESTTGSNSIMDETPLWTFPFNIGGVPVMLNILMSLDLGYQVSVTAPGKISQDASASGYIKYGITYNPDTKSINNINDHNYQVSADPSHLSASNSVNFDAVVGLTPMLFAKVDGIGGPFFTVKPSIEVSVDASGNACNSSNQNGGLDAQVVINAGVQAYLGTSVSLSVDSVNVLQYSSAPVMLFTVKKPMASYCSDLSDVTNQEKEITLQFFLLLPCLFWQSW